MLCDVLIRFPVVVSRRKQATFSISQLYAFLSSLETNTVTITKVLWLITPELLTKFFKWLKILGNPEKNEFRDEIHYKDMCYSSDEISPEAV